MPLARLTCLVLAAAALATPSLAQPTPSPERRSQAAPAHEDWRARMEARMAEHRRQEAADVALLLHLTPVQQTAFEALKDHGRHGWWGGWKDHGAEGEGPRTTGQMIEHMQARMTEREAHAKMRLDALRSFYASLSPEQKPLFDALMRLRMGGGRGGMGRRHGMHGGMGGPGGHGPDGAASPGA